MTMASSGAANGGYEVHNSAALAQAFVRLQQQATDEGRGEALLQAGRAIYDRLHTDPTACGEPLYRLAALRMQVRCVVVRPLCVDFAVCEDRPMVFIKSVKLLPALGPA
jgi:hypothetical protein